MASGLACPCGQAHPLGLAQDGTPTDVLQAPRWTEQWPNHWQGLDLFDPRLEPPDYRPGATSVIWSGTYDEASRWAHADAMRRGTAAGPWRYLNRTGAYFLHWLRNVRLVILPSARPYVTSDEDWARELRGQIRMMAENGHLTVEYSG